MKVGGYDLEVTGYEGTYVEVRVKKWGATLACLLVTADEAREFVQQLQQAADKADGK